MSSNTTLKLFNKFSSSVIKDFVHHLESNDIQIPNDIVDSFLVDKPSKRKGKLSPYTVFMKEFRSNYQKQHPELSFQDVSRAIAKEWSKIKENPQKLKEYEEKAQKHNHDMPHKQKKICKATKGSDKQPCQAEAKGNSDYCGRHKKLAFDQVDPNEDIIPSQTSSEAEDYLSCQTDGCNKHAESGPFCSTCGKKEKKETKKCIKEKPNGQTCDKKATKGDYCGFHNPNKPKKSKKKPVEKPKESESEMSVPSEEDNFGEQVMYYDEKRNIYHHNIDGIELTKFITYDNDPMAYNSNGDEIGVIKENKIEMF